MDDATDTAQQAPARQRRPRADAQRNREKLLAVAEEVFAAGGWDSSLEEIARRAGVGIGTLYRNFPTRADLAVAIYRRDVESLGATVDELLATERPDVALGRWMDGFVDIAGKKRGMAESLKAAADAEPDRLADIRADIIGGLDRLLGAAIEAGAIRPDVEAPDVLRAIGGVCMAADPNLSGDQARRLVHLILDGLRYGAPAAHTST